MAAKTDLYDEIIRASTDLFMKQSYAATSIKQIASAAGCTTAALYYYFEDGKESILRKVIERVLPDLTGYLGDLDDASSLTELILRVSISIGQAGEEILIRTRWLMVEFPNLGQAERDQLHEILLAFQRRLADLIEPFVTDRKKAELLAWIEYSAMFGYGQLFVTLGLETVHEPLSEKLAIALAELIGNEQKDPR